MAGGPDRDEAELLVFDADAPPTHPVRAPRPTIQGRRRGSSRGVGIAVVVLIVLTAGVAAGSILEPNLPRPSSEAAAPDCAPAPTDGVPVFKVGTDRSPATVAGAVGYTHLPAGDTGDSNLWKVPGLTPSARNLDLTTETVLTIRVDGDRCIRYLVAERAPATIASPTAADRTPQIDAPISPSSPVPALGSLPEGDWVIRVTAYFETGVGGSGGLVIGQRFFRVQVGDGPFASVRPVTTPRPLSTPAITPAFDCGPTPETTDAAHVVLLSGSIEPVAGVAEGVDLPVATVMLGDQFELATDGLACALSWTITVFDAESGAVVDEETTLNPNDRPDVASQNRWVFDVPVGPHDVVAALHFGPDLDVVRFWRVVGEGFSVPDVVLTGENGTQAEAVAVCGLQVELSNGYSSGEDCGPVVLPDVVPVLRVPAWSVVGVDVPGWTLLSWNGQCGHIQDQGGGQSYFEWECTVGGFYSDIGMEPPGPPRFLARPGEQLIQLYIQARSDEGTFTVQMFVRVRGE